MIQNTAARQITLGLGTIEVCDIHHDGRHGILFRPSPHVPVGEPGRLQNEGYMPDANDVVVWIENNDGADVLQGALCDVLAALSKTAT